VKDVKAVKEVKTSKGLKGFARAPLLVAFTIFTSFIIFMPFMVQPGREATQRRNPTVPELLEAVGRYIADYEKQFAAIVSEERYQQNADTSVARGPRSRLLRSDALMFSAGPMGWITLRDVFEVDGKPVHDHTDRILKLVSNPSPDEYQQAKRIAEESARYNIGSVSRTINFPTMPLVFIRIVNQTRSEFSFEGMDTVERLRVAELAFKETVMPRVINSIDDAPAAGKFWIEPGTGRVVRTELRLKSGGYTVKIETRYANQPKLGLWVPVRMDEEYRLGAGGSFFSGGGMLRPGSGGFITGRADYRNFRQFSVDVSTIIK
jgi:hypothetical protein